MDTRRVLAFAGGIVAGGVLTVTCTVAISGAVALTDVAGESVSATPVVLPSGSPSTSTAPTPSASAATETVPAPEPRSVTVPGGSQGDTGRGSAGKASPKSSTSKTTPSTPGRTSTTAPSKTRPTTERTASAVIAQYLKDGDWRAVRTWALAQGWDRKTIATWLRYVRENYRPGDADHSAMRQTSATKAPHHAGDESGDDLPCESTGSKKEQSRDSSPQ